MSEREKLTASLSGLEIGATGPSTLQLVLETKAGNIAIGFTSDEARWLASALQHWAAESEAIKVS